MEAIAVLNLDLLQILNGYFEKSPGWNAVITFFAEYYVVFLVGLVLFFIYRDYRSDTHEKFRVNLLGLLLTLTTLAAVTVLLRDLFELPRPYLVFDIAHLSTYGERTFPSAHTIIIFGMAAGMYFYNKRLAYFLALSGLLVGISRVAAGVHYPSDILGGILLGTVIGFLVELTYRSMRFSGWKIRFR